MRAGTLHSVDLTLVLCTIAACTVGVLMVFSATRSTQTAVLSMDDFAVRQAIYALIGLVLMLIISRIDYRFVETFAVPLYTAALALLGLVLVLGVVSNGSQRWLHTGVFPIQPSELAKVGLIILLAKLYTDHERELHKPRWFVAAGLLTAVPAIVVFKQPDLGTAIMLAAIFLGVSIGAGVPLRMFLVPAALAIPAAFGFWTWGMQDYQRARLLSFLNPEADLLGSGYNIIQAHIAIGSGGWFGQGYLSGSQSQLGYTPVQYSDFIFSVVAEEFGWIGSVALIALMLFLVWRCLVVASRARDTFGSLVAVGVATWIGVQVFINVGMNIGLMPVTGIPLPFISYGGSSLMSMLIGLGLVQSVAFRSTSVVFGGAELSPGWARSARTTLRPR